MAERAAVAAAPPRYGRPARPRLVVALAVTQTVGYGVLYYAFAAVLTPITADLATTPAVVTGALTVAVLVSAVAAVPVGRWLDRRGGRGLMTAGSVVGTLAVAGWSQVDAVWQLYAVFVAIGVASAMVLYEPAFAVVVAVLDAARRASALLAITIVAGFASTIFIPLTGALTERYGWRTTVLVLAAVHTVTIPLHGLALRRTRPERQPRAPRQDRRNAVGEALRDARFWLLTAGFVLQGAALATVGVHLVRFLVALGHPPVVAAGVTGLLGVFSVTGRLVTTGLARRLPVAPVTAAVFALQGLAAGALPLVGRDIVGAVSCVVVFGLGFGVSTIARPAILASTYDTRSYGTIAGILATPTIVARAVAPLGAAALTAVASDATVLAAVAAACLTAAGCLAAIRPAADRGDA